MSGYVVFDGARRIAAGSRLEAAVAAQARLAAAPEASVLIFDPDGRQVDFDLRGGPWDIARRLGEAAVEPPRGRGRPKLGVTAREVTLLPRHWEWLAAQPGGASVALRKLVEAARRETEGPSRRRAARDATYRFAQVMAGDRAGFEDATRALFAGDAAGFAARITDWPADIAEHLRTLAAEAFEAAPITGV
ncbi:hypothetical protein PMI01_02911 [Caulobacter sp. AP07]|uniref:DUF2239 family protein n=1 Tax=Caulobacter sp. AP07 TaxID=1144304 RepID=UPI000271DEE0|nr:DUF2239 family protein [Caulobacter sp. AP07]EJL31102.1 hypothetical protein PMI01_02911 [Caulobacter sp. AP07]